MACRCRLQGGDVKQQVMGFPVFRKPYSQNRDCICCNLSRQRFPYVTDISRKRENGWLFLGVLFPPILLRKKQHARIMWALPYRSGWTRKTTLWTKYLKSAITWHRVHRDNRQFRQSLDRNPLYLLPYPKISVSGLFLYYTYSRLNPYWSQSDNYDWRKRYGIAGDN